MTEDKWMDSIRPDTTFVDAYIAVLAGSWTFACFFDGNLSMELEGNVGRHFGDQDHWEFNLPVDIRWQPAVNAVEAALPAGPLVKSLSSVPSSR